MRLLIVGHLKGQLTAATKIAMDQGAQVLHAETIEQALKVLSKGNRIELLMVDVCLDVNRLMRTLSQARIHVDVVGCGVDSDPDAAAAAIQAGAKEYIPLPPDPELIAAILEAVAQDNDDLICADSKSKELLALAAQIAPSDATVLITGESGCGKEVIARYIHANSSRVHAPFISLNCAAIPEHLLESELFGHEKGAFTGALNRRIGKFEEAHGGTLLLDEISEMDLRLQAKLLRVLQERVVERVGSNQPIPIDIRVLATSNRNMAKAVAEGLFREDLFYRLNVVNLAISPLRERPADIAILARYFVEKYVKANGFPGKSLSAEVEAYLATLKWPGNVRELENTMHRAVLLSGNNPIVLESLRIPSAMEISAVSLSSNSVRAAQAAEAATRALVGNTVASVERELILNTLEHCLGNRTHASHILGISIRTLRNKLNQYSQEGLVIPPPNTQHDSLASVFAK